jgi:hypothetical protein
MAIALALAVPITRSLAQPAGGDFTKYVPGKWMSANGKTGIEIASLRDGAVTGTWLDITGITYPVGSNWIQGKAASGRVESGLLHLVLPTGNKMELRLSPDGSTLSGSRQVIGGGSYDPGLNQVTFKRN